MGGFFETLRSDVLALWQRLVPSGGPKYFVTFRELGWPPCAALGLHVADLGACSDRT